MNWKWLQLAIWVSYASLLYAVDSRGDLQTLERKVKQVSEKSVKCTVALVSEKSGSSGSGIIVSQEGLILTAAHVIQGLREVDVYFPDGKKFSGKVLGANFSKDIGMVKIIEKGPWPHVELGESKPLGAGDWVIAVGHSAGFEPTRTPPVRFGRIMSDGPGNYFTTDCTLIGGDSGGPLFDLGGRLVAVNSSIGESWKNNNHAGIDGFREDWQRLLEGETWGTLELNPMANPESPVIGIEMGMSRKKGVLVAGVSPNSPAAAAGLKIGDIIQNLNGQAIRDGAEFQEFLIKFDAGDTLKLGVLRDVELLEIDVVLSKREDIYRLK